MGRWNSKIIRKNILTKDMVSIRRRKIIKKRKFVISVALRESTLKIQIVME